MTSKNFPDDRPTPKVWRTLSVRIVFVFMLLMAFVLIMISWLATVTLRSSLIDETDRNLRSSGRTMATVTIEQLLDDSQSQILPNEFYLYITYDNPYESEPVTEFTVVNQIIAEENGTPADPRELAQRPTSAPFTVPSTIEEQEWRIITADLSYSPTNLTSVGSVVIGLPMEPIEETVRNLAGALATLVLITLVLGALTAYLLVDQSLTGLRDIERATHEVAARNLSVRVPTGTDGSEVALLGASINRMLSRVEESFEAQAASEQRMRQFVSDASHELRTPLATIRGYAELYRLGGVPDDGVELAMSRIESESQRMAHLVDDLLQLARLDERRKINMQAVDLASTAINTIHDFHVRAPDWPATVVGLDGGEPRSVVVTADEEKVTQVITNLISNVRTHTPEGTPIEVAVGIDPANPKTGVVEVRDHGPGIAPEDADRIFERFYRTDSSRSRVSGGSGLGLAIVSAIMHIHDGQASVSETSGGGLTVRLEFPGVHGGQTGDENPCGV
ncbi:two-component system OmpR family sensor kinase [Trueperella bonasi]|uniref:histidine kinase n=1 Tax=Trueperella bonasi TaxID=312286 RepID=A0ABT9NGR2_9ACTO|nr:HAMP domain-containing sensor histidine kinase [Trueperella bonasi]MDP9806188.1 two-component system OmpR family sensor kinase [Trueperella bonasi]